MNAPTPQIIPQGTPPPPPKENKRGRKTFAFDSVGAGLELAPFYQQLYVAKHGTAAIDNFPLFSSTSYGQNGTPDYYFMSEPNESQLANSARYSPLGNAGTYVFAKDVWINNFVLEFPGAELGPLEIKQVNQEIFAHNMDIGLYDEFRRGTAYNYEQGEAGVMIYRQGDGDLRMYQELLSDDPNYGGFNKPADTTKEIIRLEAINKMDYTIPMIESFGIPRYYNINFFSSYNRFSGYNIHPSRMIRLRTEQVDYDQYKGQSRLKAVFAQLTIIQNICRSAGQACHNMGYGLPWIQVKGARTKEQMAYVKSMIGNPTAEDYFITNAENIQDIKMLGFQSSQMDMAGIVSMLIDQLAAAWKTPTSILMGKESGVTQGSEVYERSYFNCLDGEHSLLNKYLRQFIAIDPFYTRIFLKHKIKNYVINWGLRQVMTKEQEADWKMRLYNNVISKMRFAAFDECRAEGDLPSFFHYFNDPKHPEKKGICEKLYGLKPEELDCAVPDLGQWRQRILQELITSPEEKEANKQAEELAKGNVPNALEAAGKEKGLGQKPPGAISPLEKKSKELEKVGAKMEREHGGDVLKTFDTAMGVVQAKEDLLADMIQDFKTMNEEIAKKRRLSLNDIAELGNVSKSEVTKLFDTLDRVCKHKDVTDRLKQSDKGREH
jgi:hypothetical protein